MRRLLYIVCFSLFISNSSFSENPKLGINSDGRAYRIDSQGNKVVDYIAELESNVDGLQRQVQGLEEELQEKIEIITKLQNGQVCEDRIKEKDLVENQARFADTNFVLAPAQNSSQTNAQNDNELKLKCDRDDMLRRNEIVSLQEKLALMQNENQLLRAKTNEKCSNKSIPSDSGDVLEARKDLEVELEKVKSSAGSIEEEIREINDRIAQLKDEFRAKKDEYDLLQTKIAVFEKRADNGMAASASLKARASLAPNALKQDSRLRKSELKDQALESVKASINTGLNQVQSSIVARDRMFKEYKAHEKNAVAFSPSAALSSRGEDLGMLRNRLNQSHSMQEAAAIQAALREIERKVEDDISLMRRLKRLQ